MKNYLDKDFLLDTPTAVKLYEAIGKLPIIDYHCHLDAKEIYEDKHFGSLTEVWLQADHYKWRAMRNMGVEEKYITGDAEDYDKFVAWATIMPYMAGHPLYHFSHLELKKYLGVDVALNKNTAREIYDKANATLLNLGARDILKLANVETVVTTNDPTDNLEYHIKLKEEGLPTKILPAFRPDKAVNIEKAGFREYIDALSKSVGKAITTFDELKEALLTRLNFFESVGCKASDHGLDYMPYNAATARNAEATFLSAMNGNVVTKEDGDGYKTALLTFLAEAYARRGIVMEIHFGCVRNANSDMFNKIGADTGFDCIRGETNADNLYPFLDSLEKKNALPRTLLFSLNPNDNDELITVMGAFNKAPYKGKVQQGSAWWFNDNKQGMERQIATYASGAPIDSFIGMLTDSRSLLSYARHDYFRRILANYLGNLVENGEYPVSDYEFLEEIAKNVAYYNTKKYFGF